jgi:hypothetical protein
MITEEPFPFEILGYFEEIIDIDSGKCYGTRPVEYNLDERSGETPIGAGEKSRIAREDQLTVETPLHPAEMHESLIEAGSNPVSSTTLGSNARLSSGVEGHAAESESRNTTLARSRNVTAPDEESRNQARPAQSLLTHKDTGPILGYEGRRKVTFKRGDVITIHKYKGPEEYRFKADCTCWIITQAKCGRML